MRLLSTNGLKPRYGPIVPPPPPEGILLMTRFCQHLKTVIGNPESMFMKELGRPPGCQFTPNNRGSGHSHALLQGHLRMLLT